MKKITSGQHHLLGRRPATDEPLLDIPADYRWLMTGASRHVMPAALYLHFTAWVRDNFDCLDAVVERCPWLREGWRLNAFESIWGPGEAWGSSTASRSMRITSNVTASAPDFEALMAYVCMPTIVLTGDRDATRFAFDSLFQGVPADRVRSWWHTHSGGWLHSNAQHRRLSYLYLDAAPSTRAHRSDRILDEALDDIEALPPADRAVLDQVNTTITPRAKS